MSDRRILVASNRGPVSFVPDEHDHLIPTRGSGGLVAALGAAIEASGGLWVASAMTDGDRARAMESPDGRVDAALDDSKHAVRFVISDPETYAGFYDGISNRVLWFLYHSLWDLPNAPSFDAGTRAEWGAYREVSRSFAAALAAESGRGPADVLIQDYHLSLVPAALRALDPSPRISYFHHVPFAEPGQLEMLPSWMRTELLQGILGADLVGFHTRRWADRFIACCRLLEGARVDARRRVVRWDGRTVRVGVFPVAIDADALRRSAAAPEVRRARRALERDLGERALILRVDRTELAKNIVRGLEAFGRLLERFPEWRGRVVHLVLLNPSRQELPEYRDYLEACRDAAARVNETFATADWAPVDLRVDDDHEGVLAAYGRYDVLVVNPLYDGMNLVAMEGTALNRHGGTLVLSRNAGAHELLGPYALSVDPLDVEGTAEAIHAALRLPGEERQRRARALRRLAGARAPAAWIQRQLHALELTGGK